MRSQGQIKCVPLLPRNSKHTTWLRHCARMSCSILCGTRQLAAELLPPWEAYSATCSRMGGMAIQQSSRRQRSCLQVRPARNRGHTLPGLLSVKFFHSVRVCKSIRMSGGPAPARPMPDSDDDSEGCHSPATCSEAEALVALARVAAHIPGRSRGRLGAEIPEASGEGCAVR